MLNGRGSLIQGLKSEDFSIWDNDRERGVASFHENRNSRILTIWSWISSTHVWAPMTRASLALEKILGNENTRDICIYLVDPKGELLSILGVADWKGGSEACKRSVGAIARRTQQDFFVRSRSGA